MLEVGYPRNDLLHSPDADVVARSVRARLGIPEGKRVVLYAPTWRDDQYYSRGRYKHDMRLDLERPRAAVGDDHVLLVRLHSNVVDGVPEDPAGFVRDVSLYPDITELYLISDMMISDYSSVMFDYANTGRPMLFFTYDLADYRDRLRGFYFDFEAEAPGAAGGDVRRPDRRDPRRRRRDRRAQEALRRVRRPLLPAGRRAGRGPDRRPRLRVGGLTGRCHR